MPLREQFRQTPEYYSTLFHEATHSTGHYSPTSGTYNKKLTFKAYRAAVALTEQFNAA